MSALLLRLKQSATRKRKPLDIALSMMVWLSAAFTLLILGFLLLHVLVNGIPHLLRPGLFSTQWTTQNQSMFPAIINTVIFVFFSLMVAVPLGVFTAIYLVEYANRGNKLVGIVRMMAETLAGIPSIVYGLFGFMMFRNFMGWGRSLLAGGFTLAIMILPVIIRTTEESLKAVPDNYREGSFGLGAGRLRTVFRIVLPSAIPGIVAGVILAVGRVVGETAALIFTAGTMPHVIDSPTASGRTLSLHIYSNIMEATNDDVAYATAVVLLLLVIGINALSYGLAKISTKGRRK